ncbi:recombinase family protein [Streptomyces sp. SID3343]|uniref:recombinase family protein n=1 Tax=Streptomyces sp. SID3343 TaxID=2690260 RepID=UPI00136A4EB6|nr:recombinase family protein [Streptomyces sp. SID3343]MYW03901.1 recombinase family protein [Streptomyces sp. SID3343]
MEKQRAGGYFRQSHERQDKSEGSIRAQREPCHAEAAKRGYEYVGDYADPDLSGYKQGVVRPHFERMLNDARAGRLDVIIVLYVSRFSRQRPEDAIPVVMELHRLGVTIISVNEGDFPPGDTMKLIMLIIRLDAAHQESDNKSKHLKSTKKILRDAGSWVGGLPPYGYETEEVRKDGLTIRKLVIVEDEAEVIRAVVRTIMDNRERPAKAGTRNPGSLAGICADLNAREVPTKTARLNGKWRGAVTVSTPGRSKPPQWEVTTLKRILQDPRMIGHAVEPIYERKETKDGGIRTQIISYRTMRDPKSQEPVISHEAILRPADWYELQTWLSGRGRGKGLHRGTMLLSGLGKLFCEDGFTMSSNGTHDSTASYRCSRPKGAATGGHEGGNSIKRDHLEDFVVRSVFTKVTSADGDDPADVAFIREATRRFAATVVSPELAAETAELVMRKVDRVAAQNDLYDDLDNGIYDGMVGRERFKGKKADLEREIAAIELRLVELSHVETPTLPVELWAGGDNPDGDPLGPGSWWSSVSHEEKRAFLCLFIDRVEVGKATSRGNKWQEYDASKRVTIKWATAPKQDAG